MSWEISFSVSSNLFRAFSCLNCSLFKILFSFWNSSNLIWSSVSSFLSSLIFSSRAERTLLVTRSMSFGDDSLLRLWERNPQRGPFLLDGNLDPTFLTPKK
ncbi:hypothetical protein FKM82_024035 [Ascaphus truei]